MKIGPYNLENSLILAPMAGVTDRPFRLLCREMGAAMAVSEMVTSQQHLWHTKKSALRMDHTGESSPISVQIAGTDPDQLAVAAKFNIDNGAQIIDINMGCPAKKVCNVMAGSALMKNEKLVANILHSVVNAIDAPVTLKIRTGWDKSNKNALAIARIAEQEGIQALTIHGRTRQCAYKGNAEYETIAEVKQNISIPVIANGDITSPIKAKQVLQSTGVDAIMIGRGAHGKPWLFKEIAHYLETGIELEEPDPFFVQDIVANHLKNLYDFYGELKGVRIARKHIHWYCENYKNYNQFKNKINKIETADNQHELVTEFLINSNKEELIAA